MKCVKAIPRHAVDDHSQCNFHPLVTCSCGACMSNETIECEGKAYKTRLRLDCKFLVVPSTVNYVRFESAFRVEQPDLSVFD